MKMVMKSISVTFVKRDYEHRKVIHTQRKNNNYDDKEYLMPTITDLSGLSYAKDL